LLRFVDDGSVGRFWNASSELLEQLMAR
jgi:hypothetical protein